MNSALRCCWSILVMLGASLAKMGRSDYGPTCTTLFLERMNPCSWALGYDHDHDLSRSLAYSVDADYLTVAFLDDDETDGEALQPHHRAFTLTGGPDACSFYFGSRLGARRYSFLDDVTWSCPVGLRIGVRGGLEKFFADLFLELVAQAGGTTPSGASRSGPEAHIGVDIGFDRGRRNR